MLIHGGRIHPYAAGSMRLGSILCCLPPFGCIGWPLSRCGCCYRILFTNDCRTGGRNRRWRVTGEAELRLPLALVTVSFWPALFLLDVFFVRVFFLAMSMLLCGWMGSMPGGLPAAKQRQDYLDGPGHQGNRRRILNEFAVVPTGHVVAVSAPWAGRAGLPSGQPIVTRGHRAERRGPVRAMSRKSRCARMRRARAATLDATIAGDASTWI